MNEQKEIFQKATISALHHLAAASDAVLNVDMDRYPHMRRAAQVINEAVSVIDDSRDIAPVELPVTVIINDDNRDWDDPYIAIVDVVGCATAEDVRAVILADYHSQFCDDDRMSPETFAAENGVVIQAVTPGAVQVGWQRGGVDNDLLDDILHGQPHG